MRAAQVLVGVITAGAILSPLQGATSGEVAIYAVKRAAASDSTAYGWSGYAIERGQRYTSITGSWIVPRVSYQTYPGYPNAELSTTWIGIGGDGNDKTLIQLGTTQNIDSSGKVKYSAWYLLVSDLVVPSTDIPFPVDPGDHIAATLKCVSNCAPNAQQSWMMTMTNSTKGWTWNNNGAAFSYRSSLSSAEWIMEAPVVQSQQVIPKLPKFGSVAFTDATANGANPNLSLTADAVTMVSNDGLNTPLAIPTAAKNGNSFSVNQVGLPPVVPLPNQPTLGNVCQGAIDLGQLQFTQNTNAAGQFSGIGQDAYFKFYLSQYAAIWASPLAQLRFNYAYVDDNTGAQLAVKHGTEQAPIFVSLDPGYYCLRVFNPMGMGVQFQVQMSAQAEGLRPGATPQMAPPVPSMDIGNLTPNGYYEKSRYINDGNHNITPTLTAGHQYTLRDWIGTANKDQYYAFSLDVTRDVSIDLNNLYLGARVTIETANGGILGETVETGTPLTPHPPGQRFEGALPAGTYYLHVAFAGVGGPGTPYAVTLTAQ